MEALDVVVVVVVVAVAVALGALDGILPPTAASFPMRPRDCLPCGGTEGAAACVLPALALGTTGKGVVLPRGDSSLPPPPPPAPALDAAVAAAALQRLLLYVYLLSGRTELVHALAGLVRDVVQRFLGLC